MSEFGNRSEGREERGGALLGEMLHALQASLEAGQLEMAPHLRVNLGALQRATDCLQRQERQVVMLGAVQTGKSSVLNALLGVPLLPARAPRATAVPVQVVHAPVATGGVARRAATGEVEPVSLDDAREIIL